MRNLDKYAKDYYEPSFEDYLFKYRIIKIKEVIEKYKPKKIMEIGCGRKPVFNYLDANDYSIFVAIEPALESFEITSEYANNVNLSCHYDKIILINEEFRANRYLKDMEVDLILLTGLLHELEDPITFLKEVAKICHKKTILSVYVSNAKSLHRLLALQMGIIHQLTELTERNKTLQQHIVFSGGVLEQYALEAGFDKVEYSTYFLKPFTHDQMYQMIKNDILNDGVMDGLYAITKHKPFENLGAEICMNFILCN